jgi:hypothetical protein
MQVKIIREGTNRTFQRDMDKYSIKIEIDMKPGNGISHHSGNDIIKALYSIDVSGSGFQLETDATLTYNRSYLGAGYVGVKNHSEWDTPSVRLSSIDQFKGLVPYDAYGHLLHALMLVHEEIEKEIVFS